MKVAVTGGTGVVGRAVVRHLVGADHQVSALARSDRSATELSKSGVTPIAGDVLDGGSLARLVEGSEVVFHIAGVNEMCSKDPSHMWEVNVEGSRRVLEACVRGGVRRLVHTSSAVTLGEPLGEIGRENSTHRGHFLSEYERTKTISERLLLDSTTVEVVSVNPSSVQGPGRATGTGALFLALARGEIPVLVDTTISLVDIDDCARGHLLAATQGVPGERYVLNGATLTLREALRLLDDVRGRKRRPWFLRREVVATLTDLADLFDWDPDLGMPLCAESLRVLLHGHEYDGSKAGRDLGLVYTAPEETLRKTVDWFRVGGYL